jgi:hypothetical protein
MTRTDVVAASRPLTAGAVQQRRGSSRALCRLLILPVALLLAVALVAPTTALSAEPLSTYTSEANKPKTTPTTTPTTPSTGTTPSTTTPSKAGVSPSKETGTPAKAVAPSSESSAPTTTSAKASTLPFTGLDLRWAVAIGLLLMGVGFSILTVQRTRRRDGGR